MKHTCFCLHSVPRWFSCRRHRAKRSARGTALCISLLKAEYVPQEVIDGFTKETGIVVDYETFPNNEAMLQKLTPNPSQYDVIQPSDYMVERLVKKKHVLGAALDQSKLPNFQNILPHEYRNLPFDPGNQYSVPYMSGANRRNRREHRQGQGADSRLQGSVSAEVQGTDRA